MIGEVDDRDVIIVDDEIDTGGSMVQAVNLVKECGAQDVYMIFVHGIFSLDAAKRLAALPVKQFVTTDTIPIPPEKAKLLRRPVEDPLGGAPAGRGHLPGERRPQRGRDVQRVNHTGGRIPSSGSF